MAIAPGDRLRIRSAGRKLALERALETLAEIHFGRNQVIVEAGEDRASAPTASLRTGLSLDGVDYDLRLGRGGRGEIRHGSETLAGLEMRHADHGSVLLLEVLAVPPTPEIVFGFAGASAYARGLAGRKRKRDSPQWGKENALDDIVTLVYLDMRTGDHSGFDIGGGGGGESGGGY